MAGAVVGYPGTGYCRSATKYVVAHFDLEVTVSEYTCLAIRAIPNQIVQFHTEVLDHLVLIQSLSRMTSYAPLLSLTCVGIATLSNPMGND